MLLMGSSAFLVELPEVVIDKLDEAMAAGVTIIVGEARGACRRFQDYLSSKGYGDVIVGHAKSIRYNAGSWRSVQYGDNLKERERGMIDDCDSAVIIWMNKSGQIAKNLERLKRLGKLTYVYECSTGDNVVRWGLIDSSRVYSRPYHTVRARAGVDKGELEYSISAFLASDRWELKVECGNPSITGYYLNKAILKRGLEGKLAVAVESGSCYLRKMSR
jgi:hypothetical protein